MVDAAAKIFAHRGDVKIPGQKTVPYLQTTYLDDEMVGETDFKYPEQGALAELPDSNQMALDVSLL